MVYDPRKDTEEAFTKDTGLPGASLPSGQGYIKRPSGMVDVPQQGGMVDTYYPTTTGGKLDMFSREVPTAQEAPTQDALESLNLRKQVYDITLETGYHRDMEIAGAVRDKKGQIDPNNVDPFLMGVAQQNYMMNKNRSDMWYQNMQNKFKLIKEDATATPQEQEQAKTALLEKADDPIPIMPMEQAAKGRINPQQLNKGLGRLKTALYGKDRPYNRQNAELVAGAIFGIDWDTIPEVVDMVNQKFPPQRTTPTQPGLQAGQKSTKTAGKGVVKFVDPNGIEWDMPADKVDEALKAMPGSRVQ